MHGNARGNLLDFATDDQLRAECERRAVAPLNDGYGRLVRGQREHCVHGQKMTGACLLCGFAFDFISERDRLKADVAAVDERARAASGRCIELERERDEWKRRAEAAERDFKLMHADWKRDRSEPGPGISATPARDEGHWFDPLDLLADDA